LKNKINDQLFFYCFVLVEQQKKQQIEKYKSQIQQQTNSSKVPITKIEYIENQIFQTKYEQAKQQLISAGIKFTEQLMYHGSSPAAIESILLNNFDLSKSNTSPNGDLLIQITFRRIFDIIVVRA
jgi:hypothetical protein